MKNEIETRVIKPQLFMNDNEDLLMLNKEDEKDLDDTIKSIEDFMKNNSGKGKSEEEKDELYKQSQEQWFELKTKLENVKYNFFLNRKEYMYLTDLLLKKMEYSVDTIFFAIELKNMLFAMKSKMKFNDDKELKDVNVNTTEMIYTYHLISKHTVKGLDDKSLIFANILIKIADINKIINFYDTSIKNLSSEIQDWVASFEDGVVIENKEIIETVETE